MTIHVLVQAVLDQRQIAREADQMADGFDGAGTKASERFTSEFERGMAEASPRIQRSFHGIENAIEKVADRKAEYDKAMQSNSEERQAKAARALEVAKRAEADAWRAAGAAMKSYSDSSDRDLERAARNRMAAANAHRKQIEDEASAARKAAEELARSGMSITDQLADMGRTAGLALRGTAILGAPIVLADVAGMVGALAGALGPLTGALGAAAVGMGTFKLATQGFSDAISNMGDTTKFVESLNKLSPQAQQAAISLRNLMPVLNDLQRATQDAFFAGSGTQLTSFLDKMLPTVRETTTGVASAFNEMFSGIANQMTSSNTFASIEQFAHNTVNAFHELAPAAAPFVSALSDITSVGSGFLPMLAGQISDLAKEFSAWVGEAKSDGSLEQWMARGVNAAEDLLSTIDDVAKMFDALGDRGSDAISKVVNGVELLTSTVRVLSGDLSGLGDMMPSLGEIMLKPFNDITNIINTASSSINYMIRGLNAVAGTHIPEIPKMNPISDVAGGRPVFGGGPWMDHGPKPQDNGLSPTRSENRTSREGGIHTPFPIPLNSPDAGNQIGVGNRISGTGTWQSPFAPGQGGINRIKPVRGPKKGKGAKGQDWSAPADQWSLDNVAIGAFPGVPGPPGIPNIDTTPKGPVDPQAMWNAESRTESARFRVEETRQHYLELAHDNTTSETDLLKAKHDVGEAERDYISAQMKQAEVAQGKFKDLSKGMGDIGAALDQDFGLSQGLPGLAKNLTMFIGNLIAAPELMKLQATSNLAEAQGQPAGGYGLLGINGAQNMMNGLSPLLGRPMPGGATQGTYGAPAASGPGTDGNYPGDAALLAAIPKGIGQYDNATKDLSKGLVDCSSGVEDLVNILDGKSTAGGSLTTGSAASVLPQMGFVPGMGGPGDFRIGYNSHHMQATLPGGTNVNFGSTAAIQAGGLDGGQGAYDPAFDQHWYRPAGAGGSMPGSPGSTASFGGSSIPLPLPVTIVGGMPGGGLPGTPGAPPAPGGGGPPGANPGGGGPITNAGALNWDALAAKESGGKWNLNSGNSYYGGLQFDAATWAQYGGDKLAPNAAMATREQQIAVAQQAYNARGDKGASLWPRNYGQLGSGGATNTAATGAPGGKLFNPDGSVNASALPNILSPENTNPALTNPPAPAGLFGIGGSGGVGGSADTGGHGWIGQGIDLMRPSLAPYDANHPTGGGNFNPGMAIDTSTTTSSGAPIYPTPNNGLGPMRGQGVDDNPFGPPDPNDPRNRSGQPFVGGGTPSPGGGGIFAGPYGNGPTGATLPGPGDAPPLAPNIGPGPLQVGPPGVPGMGGAPNQIGPFPTPGSIGPKPIGGGAGPAAASPGGPPGGHYGGVTPGVPMGGTGGVGMSPGGTIDSAVSAAAAGLDLLAPGAGQAAQTGIKLANRAIQYGGQLAGIGISGLMETFLPTGGSELANSGWIPRLVGGLAGATPALPNVAGGKGTEQPPLTPDQAQQGQTAPTGQGPNIGVTINNNNASPDQNMRQADWHAQQMYQGANR